MTQRTVSREKNFPCFVDIGAEKLTLLLGKCENFDSQQAGLQKLMVYVVTPTAPVDDHWDHRVFVS
jgi:hypothetical protein